jgi:hypothetical protein
MRRQARRSRIAMAMASTLAFAPAGFADVEITHDPVDCVVAGQFPIIPALLHPPDEVTRARVYFRARGTPTWYSVDMKSQGEDAFEGVLPRPLESLEGVEYYIEALAPSLVPRLTQEYSARVIGGTETCPLGAKTATAVSSTPAALLVGAPEGAPAIPPGFSSTGVAAGASGASAVAAGTTGATGGGGAATGLLLVAGVAAGAAGVARAVGSGGEDSLDSGGGGTGSAPGGTPEPTATPTPEPQPDVTGRWGGTFNENPSATRCTVTSDLSLDLQQTGADVTGTFQLVIRTATSVPADPCPVGPGDVLNGPASGTVSGNTIRLELQIPGGGPALVLPGTISDTSMGGTDPDGGGSWQVTRL